MPTTDINLNIDAITGVGSVNFLTKIVTLEGADGTPIVTIGNSHAFENDSYFAVDFGYTADSIGTQIIAGTSGGGISARDLTNAASFDVGADTANMQAGAVGGSPITRIQANLSDILVKSPNISNGTYAYFETDGAGNFTMRGVSAPSGGISSLNALTGATQTFANDTNVTIVSAGTTHTLTWSGTLADGRIASAATWNAKESGLTFSTGLTRTVNTITIDSTVATLTGSQALTNKTVNGLTITSTTGTLTIASGKTLTVNNTVALTGTDSTTITLPTATATVLANNLGLSGGTTLIGGTGATDKIIIQTTSGNQVTGVSNLITFKSGNNGASELMRIGDGIGANIGELSIWAAGQSSSTTHIVRAGTNFTYLNAGTDLRLTVGAVSYLNCLSGAGTFAVQKPMTFASGANVTLVAGTTSLAPFVFTSGTNKTTPTNGAFEYNGTNFFATRTGAVRENILCVSAVNTVTPTLQNRTLTVNVDGTTYYVTAKTTND